MKERVPLLPTKYGRLSGAPIRPLAVAAVYRIASAVKIPIIGIGGVMTGEDVMEFLLAGASAVQVYTVLMGEGIEGFSRILRELRSFMEENRVYSIREIIGAAQKEVGMEGGSESLKEKRDGGETEHDGDEFQKS